MMENDPKKFGRDLEEQIKSRIFNKMNANKPGRYQGLIPGAVILAIGAIFLLDNLGVVNAGRIWMFWPLILIFAGLVKLLDPCRRSWGAMLMALGVFFLLNSLGVAHFSWGAFWPVILIAVGVMAMWSALQARNLTEGLKNESSDPLTMLNESAIFGGVQKRLGGKDFRGGQLQALFGGIEIDMRDADMAGTETVLHANALFGGIEIRVPETWFVATRGQGVFGGYNDSTRYNPPVDPDKPKKTLVVVGMAVFGGVEIRN